MCIINIIYYRVDWSLYLHPILESQLYFDINLVCSSGLTFIMLKLYPTITILIIREGEQNSSSRGNKNRTILYFTVTIFFQIFSCCGSELDCSKLFCLLIFNDDLCGYNFTFSIISTSSSLLSSWRTRLKLSRET